eukprot:1511111-Prymnesium_polylepis.1
MKSHAEGKEPQHGFFSWGTPAKKKVKAAMAAKKEQGDGSSDSSDSDGSTPDDDIAPQGSDVLQSPRLLAKTKAKIKAERRAASRKAQEEAQEAAQKEVGDLRRVARQAKRAMGRE